MGEVAQLIEELKQIHGDELDLENHHYFLFFEDGVFDIYIDEGEKEFKVNVVFSDGCKVYNTSKKLADIFV